MKYKTLYPVDIIRGTAAGTHMIPVANVDERQVAVHEHREGHRLQLGPVKLPRGPHEVHQAPVRVLYLWAKMSGDGS